MRRLNKSIVVGGVVYPAGAAGPDVEAAVINPAHWDDNGTTNTTSTAAADSAEATALLADATQLIAVRTGQVEALLHAVAPVVDTDPENTDALAEAVFETEGGLEDLVEAIASLVDGADQSGEADGAAATTPQGGDGGGESKPDYSGMSKDELEDEVAKRNGDGRDNPIEVGGRGNKPDLVAALIADDE